MILKFIALAGTLLSSESFVDQKMAPSVQPSFFQHTNSPTECTSSAHDAIETSKLDPKTNPVTTLEPAKLTEISYSARYLRRLVLWHKPAQDLWEKVLIQLNHIEESIRHANRFIDELEDNQEHYDDTIIYHLKEIRKSICITHDLLKTDYNETAVKVKNYILQSISHVSDVIADDHHSGC